MVAAILAGYWVIGPVVFKNFQALSRFLIVGFSGSLIYASIRFKGWGYAVILIVLMFLTQVALDPPIRTSKLITAAIWSLPAGLAFTAAAYWFRPLYKVPVGKFLLLAVLLAAAYGFSTIIYMVRIHAPVQFPPILRQLVAGLKTGALIGLAMELVDFLNPYRPGMASGEKTSGRILPPS